MAKQQTAIIRIFDEVNCLIAGLSPNDYKLLWEKWGFFAKDYFFNPKFKLKRWDGKIRYFSKNGVTYVRLLDDIVKDLISMDYKISIDDKRNSSVLKFNIIDSDFFSHILKDSGDPYKLGEHQVNAVNAVLSNSEGIILAGTGAGKTLCVQAMCSVFNTENLYCLIIVPSADLIIQTRQSFERFGVDIGEYSGNDKDLNHMNTVSTWQALQNNPEIVEKFNVVIVDECHGVRGAVLTKLLVEHGKNILYRYGLTGTLPKHKTDELAVKITLGEVIYSIPAIELIDKGWLANLNINILQLKEHDIEKGYFPDYQSERDYLKKRPERIEWISALLESKRDKNGNVFCLVDSVSMGKLIQACTNNSVFLHGNDSNTIRKQFYDLFEKNNDVIIIATYGIASTGLSIDRIFNLFLVDAGKSFTRVIQSIGRGLRKAEDKNKVAVYDICSDLKYAKSHLSSRVGYYREANYPFTKKIIKYR